MIKRLSFVEKFSRTTNVQKKLNAFTLAEVLITLGIIGVVAAMTLPTLIAKYKEKQTVTAVKTAYSIFSQAYMRLAQDYPDLSQLLDENKTAKENSEFVFKELTKYIKTVKRCDKDSHCMGDLYKNLNGKFIERRWDDFANIQTGILANGMSFWILNGTYTNDIDDPRYSGQIGFDINGAKRPNQIGVDFFWFKVDPDGRINFSNDDIKRYKRCDIDANNTEQDLYNGYHCSYWILLHGNMDYLKRRITIDAPEETDKQD